MRIRISSTAGAFVLLSSVGVVTATATGASAQTVGPHRIVQDATGRCLDGNKAGKVYSRPCNGGNYQKWKLTSHKMDRIRTAWYVKNVATGRCLDSNKAGNVYTLPCNGGNYQYWLPTLPANWLDWATNLYLDGNAKGAVYTHTKNQGRYQIWYLK
ncbi:RICIN domain-containing protein [Actinoallomurus vinaceus]